LQGNHVGGLEHPCFLVV